jgi:pyrophosphatase PpaX
MPPRLSLSTYQAVLFDVDGTLVDSLEMIVRGLGDTYERYLGERPPRDEILRLIGMPLSKQLAHFGRSVPNQAELEEMTAYTLERYAAHKEHTRPFDAAVETLRHCHEMGAKTALVTSKNDVELEGFLKDFEGTPYVHATVCASDIVHPKPAPDAALLACEKLDVEPSQAVFIGDSIYDMRCALDAGCAAIAVAYGAAQRDALLDEQPNLLLDTPEELLAWARSSYMEPTWLEKGS